MEATKPIHPKLSLDPMVRMRARLDDLDARIADLKNRHRQGDILAGRLAETLEVEQSGIQSKLARPHTAA